MKGKVLLEVEDMFNLTDIGAAIVCRSVYNNFQFGVAGKDFLNNVPLSAIRVWPNTKDVSGVPRLDVFTFILRDIEDRDKFTKGQIVEYRTSL